MLDIYKTRYRFNDHPFRLNPDYRFSLDHPSYARAKAYLQYAISQAEGFIAITGEPGTGKTTLINGLLAELDKAPVLVATLTYAQLDPRHLIQMVATSFGLPHSDASKATLLSELEQFLIKEGQSGRHAVLIVDEAQGMSAESLEELRLLSNLQHGNQLLIQIFLVGQQQLMDMIHGPGMEHLLQRLIAASHLDPLNLEETVAYVEHRLCHVGWQGDPAIEESALRGIHRFSGGVPRRINLICHRLFLYGGLEDRHELTGEDVRHVVEELRKERVLPAAVSYEDLAEETVVPEPGESGVSALRLPRADSPIPVQQTAQGTRPAQPELHSAAESTADAATPDRERDRPPDHDHGRIAGDINDIQDPGRVKAGLSDAGSDAMTNGVGTMAGDSRSGSEVGAEPETGVGSPPECRGEGHGRLRRLLVKSLLGVFLLIVLLIALDHETRTHLRDALAVLTHSSSWSRDTSASHERQVSGEGKSPEGMTSKEDETKLPDTAGAVVQAVEGNPSDNDARAVEVYDQVGDVNVTASVSDAEPRELSSVPDPTSGVQDTMDTPIQGGSDADPVLGDIGSALEANGFRTERVDGKGLKVNLRSRGMFEFNSNRLSERALDSLTRLAAVLKKQEGMSIHVVGHTDTRGHPQYNLQLSELRAKAVEDYLVKSGLPENLIKSAGRGDLDTRYEEATQGQPELRRRVEIYLNPLQQQ
jgi:type II secretory pathway predicted ATPase ExeA/outer membrane protein OmpA-like peptidoglycan-associated protein